MKALSLRRRHFAAAAIVALVTLTALIPTVGMIGCGDAPAVGIKIRTWHDLAGVSNDLDASIILMNDLDSTTAGYAELAGPTANQGRGWVPIGIWPDPFTGSFDGQSFEIRDLFIDRRDEDNVGLFSFVSIGVRIKSVAIIDADVTGRSYVGALVGHNHNGEVNDCHSTGNVAGNTHVGGLIGEHGGVLINSYSSASVSGSFEVGGLVGENHGLITASYAAGSATGDDYVGGLVGWNRDTINNSYSMASAAGTWFIGGLVGQNRGSVSSCYSTGSVTGLEHVGGLLGRNYEGTVDDCFWDIDTSGQLTSAGGIGKNTSEMQSMATFPSDTWNLVAVASPSIRDTSYVWNIVEDETYPFLSWQSVA